MLDPSRVQVRGPLEAFAVGFAVELRAVGYRRVPVVFQLRLMAHASRWLEEQGLLAAALTSEEVERFLDGGSSRRWLCESRHGACDVAAAWISARAWGGAAAIKSDAGRSGRGVAGGVSRVSGGRAWVDGRHDRGVCARGSCVPGRSRYRRKRAGVGRADGR